MINDISTGQAIHTTIPQLSSDLNRLFTIVRTIQHKTGGHTHDGTGNEGPMIASGSIDFPLLAPDGTAAAPSYSFSGNAKMGLYRIGVNILGIATDGVERVRVDATGIVTLSESLLATKAVTGTYTGITITNSSGPAGSNIAAIKLRAGDDTRSIVISSPAATPNAKVDVTGGSLDINTTVNIAGSVIITALTDLSAAGAGQIKFPATQNASSNVQTLDDYEEGTWTPSIGGTATYTTQKATYTKIGKQVFAYCELVINVIGTGSTTNITGLPFSAVSTASADRVGGGVINFAGIATSVVSIWPSIDYGTAVVQFNGLTAAAVSSTLPITVFATGARMEFFVVYEAAT